MNGSETNDGIGQFVRVGSNEVSVVHPDGARLILQAPLWKTRFYSLFAIPNSNYTGLMAILNPKIEAAKRPFVVPPFSMSNLLKVESSIDELLSLMEARLLQVSKDNNQVDFSQWIKFLIWDIVGELTFSRRFGFLDTGTDVRNVQKNTFWLGFYVTFMGYCHWLHILLLGNPILRWLDFQPNEHTLQTCVRALAERETTKRSHLDMVDYWTKAHSDHPTQFSKNDVFAAAVGNVGAGGDGPASAVNAFFYLMLKAEPVYLQSVLREIDHMQHLGKLSRIVQYNEGTQLPYLQACIKETLRYFPAVGWNLPRIVPAEGLTIGTRHFTAGTILSINPYAVHRDETLFGPDAGTFNPSRWMVSEERSRQLDGYMVPFGGGYNVCPGQNLARIELTKITATVLRDFEIRLVDPDKEWEYHRTFIVPQTGWDCYVQRRGRREEVVDGG